MKGWTILIFVLESFFSAVLCQELPGENMTYSYGCWGDHDIYSNMKANCSKSAGHIIAVSRIRAGAKLSSITTCQRPMNQAYNSSFFYQCCKEDSDNSSYDCTFEFDYPALYETCSGKTMCDSPLPVRQQVISNCSNGNYGYNDTGTKHSTYMIFDHYCIEDSRILECPSGRSSLKNKVVYLWSDGYSKRMARNCECSIETQNSTIKVFTVHNDLRFESGSNSSCMGNASIIFTAPNGSEEKQITCQGNRKITELFISSSNYIKMIFNTSTGKIHGGFWLAFEATQMSATVTIQCVSDVGNGSSQEAPPGPPGLPLVWIIVAVIGSLIFLIVLIICCKKCCSDKPPDKSNQVQPGNTKWKLPGPVMSADDPAAPRKHKRGARSSIVQEQATPQPNALPPILEAGTTTNDHKKSKKTRKAEKKKKRKKKRKHRSKAHDDQGQVENASTENDTLRSKNDGKNADKDVEAGGNTREQ